MRIVAFIAEYNPFHHGHKYHLEESLSITGASHSVALMSGSFVQRGQPALVDKWTRAKMALDNGVDLVLELPFVYSCQSAEYFAQGAIGIINSLNVIDYLSFGSELGNLEPLNIISDILIREPDSYRLWLKKYLSEGYSYPVSRSKALINELEKEELLSNYPMANILKGSNNILSIEYLKSLSKSSSTVKPITIKRLGEDYNSPEIKNNIASATGIRKVLFHHGIPSIKDLVPRETFNLLSEFNNRYNTFNQLGNYETIIRYLLMTKNKDYIKSLHDIESGLENRIVEKAMKENHIENIIELITSKRYPSTRIQRILIHLLHDIDANTIKELYSYPAQYIRVLAANMKGLEVLSQIKEQSNISVITKYASYKKLNNPIIKKFLHFEEKATDIYYWGLNNKTLEINNDYYTSPYIKKP